MKELYLDKCLHIDPEKPAERVPGQGEPDTPPLFEIHSLEYHYPDGHPALKGIDLTIHRGDRLALVGQNGSGKTTLIKHLNGLYRPRSGEVLYKGSALTGPHLLEVRRQVGMLFQDPDDQLFCNTLDEDVAFGPRNCGLSRREMEICVENALRKTGLDLLRYKAPHHLSYGQKKRAAFATLLSMDPEVLILDEPTANLDPKQERFFAELLGEFPGTLICISHDLPFLYGLCNRAVVLENGQIHHDFSMRELVAYRAYLREHGLDFSFRMKCCRNDEEESPGELHVHSHVHSPNQFPSLSPEEKAPVGGDDRLPDALIHMSHYSYRYPDGTRGIREIALSILEGESVAVVGENGAGKSTLVSCLAGILEGEGAYFFDGNPVSEKFRKNLWRHVGIAFQDPADQLFCPSCFEEVAFGPKQLRLPSDE